MRERPTPTQDPHIPIFIIPMRPIISTTLPHEPIPHNPIFDTIQIGILHNHIGELHIDRIITASPEAEYQRAVDYGRQSEEHVVVFEELRANPEEEGAWKGVQEDGEGGGGVIEESGNIAEFLEEG